MNVAELLAAAGRELDAGRYEAAATYAKCILEIEPRNIMALRGLAAISYQLNNWDEAAQCSYRACVENPSDANFTVLLDVSRIKASYNLACDLLLKLLEIYPTNVKALSGLAALYERAGYRQRAIEYYERAVTHSRSVDLYQQYGKLIPFQQSGQMLKTLLSIQPPDTAGLQERLHYEMQIVNRKEFAERAARGLGIMAVSLDDLFFKFAKPERDALEALVDRSLPAQPEAPFLRITKAICLFSRGAYKESQVHFQFLANRNLGQLEENVVFDDAFFHGLEAQADDDVLSGLPPLVDIVQPSFAADPVILLSCDYKFFKFFARPMLSSIERMSPNAQVQLHVINPPTRDAQDIMAFCQRFKSLTIGLSIEQAPNAKREYFNAIRFVRFYQFLRRHKLPIFVLDVDALLRNDIKPTFENAREFDVTLMAHAGMWAPWNQFRAGIVGVAPTDIGLRYARLIALYIAAFHKKSSLRWGIDQIALYAVYLFLSEQQQHPSLKLLGDAFMTDECNDDAIVWCKSGNAKFEIPSVLSSENALPDSPRVKYVEALKALGYFYQD